MTKDRIKTRAIWVALYAALFSAVAFASTSPTPAQDRAKLSPVMLDAQAPAFSARPVVRRADI